MAGEPSINTFGQFELHPLLGSMGKALCFSQAPLYMMISVGVVLAFLYYGIKPAAIVPGRFQASVEMSYEFIHDMTMDAIGSDGIAYFPFIFALFFFILAGNYIGLLPYQYTFTSHIAITFALAVATFTLAIVVSIKNQGLRFFAHFMPEGVSLFLAPLLVPIEILTFLSRPVSLAIRLFANMVAGHVMFDIFGAFVVMLAGFGVVGDVCAIGPVALNVALMAFELLVGVLQAYVFAILACIYLREAVAH
ncbi:MAG: F0F1 ATP synthase subunit A [Acetobacter sp.]|nr:F0F1 ATP synthase subunit A [Acetobacter sp.]MBO7351210.1 F0F1 ATP synthase subunit A [Acetobacter sp.]MBQ5497282.1 F0F1 ATP synthase subunit A [Acetobacter sp.]